ncbi:MAG: hypothetical protein L6R38_004043 [Xanthoria sp. 2 TBL-2021]|nr:MAG: hypothetical protein L6R38_004043 [Xanthoria sp. 2 TBL-2021]
MAPTMGKRSAIRARASKTSSTTSNPTRHTHPKAQNAFSTTKKDKRMIKRSALISRIEKSKAQPKKRRRPSKKLVADLEALAAALPDAPPRDDQVTETGIARIRHRSLKSKPGAMKKREKIISREKDRFNRNMAQMAAVQSPASGQIDTSQSTSTDADGQSRSKWAALRSHIQQTMDHRPDS